MPRSFDTGLAVPYRTIIRSKVAELLAPLLRGGSYTSFVSGEEVEVKGFLKAITKLDAPLESYGSEEELNRLYHSLLGRAPAILIALGDRDLKAAGTGGTRFMSSLEVHVYFLSNHNRSLLARVEADVVAAGDGEADPPVEQNEEADAGIDVAMQCAEELLIGQRVDTETPGAVIKHLELKRERPLYTTAKHTLWTQMYLVGVTRTINQLRGSNVRLTQINTLIHSPLVEDPTVEPDSIASETAVVPPPEPEPEPPPP